MARPKVTRRLLEDGKGGTGDGEDAVADEQRLRLLETTATEALGAMTRGSGVGKGVLRASLPTAKLGLGRSHAWRVDAGPPLIVTAHGELRRPFRASPKINRP